MLTWLQFVISDIFTTHKLQYDCKLYFAELLQLSPGSHANPLPLSDLENVFPKLHGKLSGLSNFAGVEIILYKIPLDVMGGHLALPDSKQQTTQFPCKSCDLSNFVGLKNKWYRIASEVTNHGAVCV